MVIVKPFSFFEIGQSLLILPHVHFGRARTAERVHALAHVIKLRRTAEFETLLCYPQMLAQQAAPI